MEFGLKHYSIKLVSGQQTDALGSNANLDSGALVFVYTTDSKTLATIYSDFKLTSKTNPISRTVFAAAKSIDFWSAATSHDLYVNLSTGEELVVYGVTPSTHLLVLDRATVHKHLVIPFTGGSTEVDSGIDFPNNVWVKALMVDVVTADTTETLDVGILSTETSGDANGLLSAVSLGIAGMIKPIATTTGTTETYISTYSYGALMGPGVVGTNAESDFGLGHITGHFVTGANGRSISHQASAGTDTGAGYIHIWFDHLR